MIKFLSVALVVSAAIAVVVTAAPLEFLVAGHFNSQHLHTSAATLGWMSNETLSGIAAAFMEQNNKGGIGGRNLTYDLLEDLAITERDVNVPKFVTAITTKPALLALVGPGVLTALISNAVARAVQFPTFGPATLWESDFTSATTAGANNLIHTRLNVRSEASALLNYAVNSELHCKTIYLAYIDELGVDKHALHLKSEILRLGLPDPVLAPFPLVTDLARFEAAFPVNVERFTNMTVKPNCILSMMDAAPTSRLIPLLAKTPGFDADNTHILAVSHSTLPRFIDPSTGSTEVFKNLYLVQQFPHPQDNRYLVVKNYNAAMTVLKNSGTYTHGTTFVPNYFALEGYVAARLTIAALKKLPAGTAASRTSLREIVYSSKMISVDDLVLGPYGDGCIGHQTSATGPCYCTSGNRQLFFSRVNGATGLLEPVFDNPNFPGVAEIPVPLTDCALSSSFLKQPYIALVPRDTTWTPTNGYASNASFAAVIQDGVNAAVLSTTVAARSNGRLDHGPIYGVPFTASNISDETLHTVDGRYRVVVIVGAAINDTKVYGAPPLISPGVQTPDAASSDASGGASVVSPDGGSNMWKVPYLDIGPAQAAFPDRDVSWLPAAQHNPRRIAFYPTLTDLAMAAAAYVAQRTSSVVSPIVSVVADSRQLLGLASKCVETRIRQRPSFTKIAASKTASDFAAVPTAQGSYVIVVTREPSVIAAAEAFAAANAGVTVILAADEYVLEGATSSSAANVKFVSGLPSYDAGAGSARKAYAAALAATVLALYELRTNGTADAIISAVFRAGSLSVGSFALGPLSSTACPTIMAPAWPHPGGDCQCSKGLNTFYVHGINVIGSNVTVAADFSYRHGGCGPTWVALPPTPASGLTSSQKMIIGITASAGGLLITACFVAFIYLFCCASKTRDNARAPKDPKKPFAMVFTDIQASTRLWAALPDLMGDALDTHHALLRRAVTRYNGYEVKTIGDSFMVAFEKASDALEYCMAVQLLMYNYDFETTAFDEVYRELTHDSLVAAGGEAAASAAAPIEDYTALWNGLRVRVGMHVGTGDIRFDETTQGYDYYGTVVNTAARVEGVGHGGQILLTEAAIAAVCEERHYTNTSRYQCADGSNSNKTATTSPVENSNGNGQRPSTTSTEEPFSKHPYNLPPDVAASTYIGPQPLRGLIEPVTLFQVLPTPFALRRFPMLRLDVENNVAEEIAVQESKSRKTSVGLGNNALPIVDTGLTLDEDTSADNDTRSTSTHTVAMSVEGICGDLVRRLRVRNNEDNSAVRLSLFLFSTLKTLIAASKSADRTATIKLFAKSWRIDALRSQYPLYRRGERAIGKENISLLLTVVKVVQAIESTAGTQAYGSRAAGPFTGVMKSGDTASALSLPIASPGSEMLGGNIPAYDSSDSHGTGTGGRSATQMPGSSLRAAALDHSHRSSNTQNNGTTGGGGGSGGMPSPSSSSGNQPTTALGVSGNHAVSYGASNSNRPMNVSTTSGPEAAITPGKIATDVENQNGNGAAPPLLSLVYPQQQQGANQQMQSSLPAPVHVAAGSTSSLPMTPPPPEDDPLSEQQPSQRSRSGSARNSVRAFSSVASSHAGGSNVHTPKANSTPGA